jgi:hypothetical protein
MPGEAQCRAVFHHARQACVRAQLLLTAGWCRARGRRRSRDGTTLCLAPPCIGSLTQEQTFGLLVGGFDRLRCAQDHEACVKNRTEILLAGCRAHCFRKFEAASDLPEATRALELIGRRYVIDDRAEGSLDQLALRRTESPAGPRSAQDLGVRTSHAQDALDGQGAAYVIASSSRLTRSVDDARAKQSLRIENRAAAPRSASSFYSLIETTKLHHVDPRQYLRAAILARRGRHAPLPADLARPPPGPAAATSE